MPLMPTLTPQSPPKIPVAIKLVAAFILLSASVGLYFGIARPVLAAAQDAAERQASTRYLTTVYAALAAYTQDFAGQLPPSTASLSPLLVPKYLPSLEGFDGPNPTYYYLPLGDLTQVKSPQVQMILYERPGRWRQAGGTNITADGLPHLITGLKYDEMIRPLQPPRP